ncbi:hypothetical protein RclHR1_00160025 [Rhizophagus clarus]|uniref:BTB domain-containing protein n=1 Tax=Rhizophagus clarus TaxID=94130 RepID=A0A2Z6QU58_9GLOM|nr:hypothetical protein RclHR1_00160025 [Rhizophagus clarus]GES81089.1 hypothetical protein GLOIN_2v1472656 [Rhizophagus clarus]
MDQRLYSGILRNFENLLTSKKNYDVIIQAGEEPNQRELYAHSTVLRCQSNYFDIAFSSSWAEKRNGKFFFKKPNISPYIIEAILRYLYCGMIDLNARPGTYILNLLVATDELDLHSLGEYVQDYFIKFQYKFLKNDPIAILEIIFKHETFTKLKDYFLEIICQESDILFGTDKISALPAQILETLLLRDDLALDEIEVWNNLITWTHAQQPTVKKDPYKWTNEELTLMAKTLSKFIPLIRFHDISSKEFFHKVLPYQYLLPERLRQEILRFYLVGDIRQIGTLPSRTLCNADELDSNIINAKYLALFARWMDKKDKVLKRMSQNFNLILRGSRDGFDADTFHLKCDNKGATIVVAKIKETNKIVGGYNPLDWEGLSLKSTPDSFIFLFESCDDVNAGKIGRVRESSNAIVCDPSWGPLFGNYNNGSNDLTMNAYGKWTSATNAYPNINVPRKFDVEDYEVYQVVYQVDN